ncbi:MAG: 8-amino-7-oxononanoate synthase [Bacteroidetes bacterium GWF2_49_14]|nr:MAG: 8-amino-7-oxononanoate synthase [Bacteroidetes bacterium GWF2_49_14]HBB93632.1 8-amino-7-oxononanoate synthase [Bacteroidales bacterium]
MDVFEKIRTNKGPLGQYAKDAHGYFVFPKLEGEIKPRMTFRGKEVLTWSLNNYLGLANHPEVRATDASAAAEWGLGYPMGARAMSGHTRQHEILEEQLAAFEGKEKAYLLNYGYQGMVSIIDALLDRKDVVVYDSEAHACILDGLRMHIGKRFVYPHNNMENMEKQLQRAEKIVATTGGGVLVITEGVFGMSGDLGKLGEIVKLKKKYKFRLLVDDAHGFGTMGATGAGTPEHFGVQNDVDLYFGTFAKSMALIGGFVAGPAEVIDFLQYNMRSQIYAKSLPMPIVIGAMKRLELLRTKPELRTKLWKVVNALQTGLKAKGFNLGNTESPVTPVFLQGSPFEAANLVFDLRENYGVFCSIVIYPVVPKDVIMLRLIPTAVHSLEDVEYTIKAFSEIHHKLVNKAYDPNKITGF